MVWKSWVGALGIPKEAQKWNAMLGSAAAFLDAWKRVGEGAATRQSAALPTIAVGAKLYTIYYIPYTMYYVLYTIHYIIYTI